MGFEGLLINFSPPAQPTTQTHVQFGIYWHGFCPTFPLTNCPQKLMSQTHGPFSFLASFFLCNKVACKGYFCASIVNNMFVWRLFISHGKRKVYTNCWLDIILLKISSGQFFKTWNKRIFRVLKISELFYHQLGYLSNSSQGYRSRWMRETDSLIMVTVSWLIIEINF
jgi:hypothetical protein